MIPPWLSSRVGIHLSQVRFRKHLRMIFPSKQTLLLVQSSFANVNLMNAILGFASAVAVVI